MTKSEDKRLEEVLRRISESPVVETPIVYHPSECVNSHNSHEKTCKVQKKVMDLINDYHIYCNLCQHHYYSSSKLNDINSFFQIHINSVDHIWSRFNTKWDSKKPIFKWEKWLCTGFCEICNESGIEAFILNTKLDIFNIFQNHIKKNGHTGKYNLITKEPFDQILAKSDLFSKIYIDCLPDCKYVCKICGVKIDREALLEHHLHSSLHRKNFCQFVKKEINVQIGNRRVDFDFDELARKLSSAKNSALINKKNVIKTHEVDQLAKSEITFLTDSYLGFNPSDMEKAHSVRDEDLRQVNYCALCQESPVDMARHLSSNSHQLRVMVFDRCRSVRPITVPEYLYSFRSNPHKLRSDVEMYKKCWLTLKKQGLDFGMPFRPEYVDVDLGLNGGEEEEDSSNEEISDSSDEYTTEDESDSAGSSQDGRLNVNENEMKNQTPKKTESKSMKIQPFDNEIKTKKMSEKDRSIVRNQIKEFLESIVPSENGFFCWDCRCHVNKEEVQKHVGGEAHKSSAKRKVDLLIYRKDPEFINTVESWSYSNVSLFVCVACGWAVRQVEDIFGHLKKKSHIDHYVKLKDGSLKPISPSSYSVSAESGLFACKKCGNGVSEMKKVEESGRIYEAVKAIRIHEMNCSEIAGSSNACSNEKNVDNLSLNFERNLSIGKESEKVVEIAGVVNSVNGKAGQRELTGEGKAGKRPIVDSEVTNCSGKRETVEKSGKRGGGVSEKTKKSGRKKQQSENSKLNKKESPPKESVLKKSVEKFLNQLHTVELTEYLCGICLVSGLRSAAEDHLESEEHKLNEHYITSKWPVNVGFCKICKIIILGTNDMFRQHYASTYHIEQETGLSADKIPFTPLKPKSLSVLVIRGMPDIPNYEKDEFIRSLFSSFGVIERVRVKQFSIEVIFTNPRVIQDILALRKIDIGEKKPLSFSVKTVMDELGIVLKSSLIYVLSCDPSGVFASYLVENANKMLSSEAERNKEEMLCETLMRVIKCAYPNCKCFKFGSRVTGLTVGDVDLDVFLDYDNVYYSENQDPKVQEKIVRRVVAALKASVEFSGITGIAKCRVPIVTCLHKKTNIHCDISFRNGLSCENTNLIKFMISLDDRVKAVILFLKFWAQDNNLHGRPNFSSYALTMLVFFYLQQLPSPVLPTVEFLKSCYGKPEKVIGGWDCGFTTNPELVPKSTNSDSVVQLIHGFFNFCETFDFTENVISPLTGKPLSRKVMQDMEKGGLPKEYEKYRSKIDVRHYTANEFIILMDPFDLSHNLTKSFPSSSFTKFLYLCRISGNLLSNSLDAKYFINLGQIVKS